MSNQKPFKLGEKYRDIVHGFKGVATCRQEHLNRCDRIYLEIMKEGEIKGCWFDITQLEGFELTERHTRQLSDVSGVRQKW